MEILTAKWLIDIKGFLRQGKEGACRRMVVHEAAR